MIGRRIDGLRRLVAGNDAQIAWRMAMLEERHPGMTSYMRGTLELEIMDLRMANAGIEAMIRVAEQARRTGGA